MNSEYSGTILITSLFVGAAALGAYQRNVPLDRELVGGAILCGAALGLAYDLIKTWT